MNAPKLRFKSFEDEWFQHKIGDFFEHLATGSTPSRINSDYFKGDIPWISSGELKSHYVSSTKEYITEKAVKETNLKIYPPGTMFIAITGLEAKGTRSSAAINTVPMTTNQSCLAFPLNDSLNLDFLYYWYKKNGEEIGITYTQGTKQQSLTPGLVKNLDIFVPSTEEEQDKIAQFFNLIEIKIEHQQEKVNLLKEQKKGYMQKIFKQEIRFRDEDGRDYKSWIYKPLSKIADKISKKNKDLVVTNVISNSASRGLISQIEYFEKNIANKENIGGYYVISTGDFVYNPRISSEAPYGPVNIYTNKADGIVSPLYTCFRLKESNKKFIYYYFKSSLWYKYVYTNGDSGARHDRVSIKDSTFFEMPIALPSLEEQVKIANFLSKLDEKIQLEQQKLEILKQQKKSFMQQMFI